MEHKVGEIFELPDGRKVQVEGTIHSCNGCIFENSPCEDFDDSYLEACAKGVRYDGMDVIFKEVKTN